MAEIVRMPKLSDTMTEGTVSKWLKKVGDKVKSGDILAEIDSDKATMEFESFYDGVLLYIGVPDKKAAPVDTVLAIIGKEGEDIKAILEEEKKKEGVGIPIAIGTEEGGKKEGGGKREEGKTENGKKEQSVLSSTKDQQSTTTTKTESKPTTNNQQPTTNNSNGKMKASPLAKKLAKDKGIIINKLKGSGDGGRVIKRDIEMFQHSGQANTFVGTEKFSEEPVSQMRKTIAKRLAESKFTSPHFYLTMEIDMDECVNAREVVNEVALAKISFNDFVIKAAAHSLRRHPKVNASWRGDVIRYNEHIHIGVAVAVEEGLLVPVVRFADGKTLTQITTEVRDFAKKAKEKKLQPQDWEGNTFTISNLGMFGIEEFTAIINPPDACILAVGAIQQKPVVKDGQIVAGYVMKVTMSCDHRVVDGATGAAFLQTFRQLLENPVLLLGMSNI
jgi:pyruvate dehydrogenase E2 component (dihydrolipoamide acetyltransferase)